MTDTQRITMREGGPYVVRGGLPLTSRRPMESVHGEPLAWEAADPPGTPDGETYALCRCGGSANKPFCDGTHASNGFVGQLTADRSPGSSRREVLSGTGVTLSDDSTLCADGGFCGTRLTNVWSMIAETTDPEVREQLQRMAGHCPSGRLAVTDASGTPIEPTFLPSVATIPDGPLWVRGGVPLETDGYTFEVRNRMTLCRCGQSQNKPFCDGAHKSVGFKAP